VIQSPGLPSRPPPLLIHFIPLAAKRELFDLWLTQDKAELSSSRICEPCV
jgi:hypothetical protein